MTDPAWQLEPSVCDWCGERRAEVVLRGRDRAHGLPGEFAVVRCTRCGLARTDPRPTLAALASADPATYPEHQAGRGGGAAGARPPRGLLRWALVNGRGYPLGRAWGGPLRPAARAAAAVLLAGRRYHIYIPYTGEGRLLDFGCGTGRYVARMAAAGWRAEGVDADARAVRRAREAGLVVHHGTLPGLDLPAGAFDAVTMWQALEHVPSPKATLAAVVRLLRPGGRLVVVCPRLDSLEARWFGTWWFALELPRHLWHFTEATLRRHVEGAGLVVERVRSVRRPAVVRRSFAHLAADSGRAVHRALARSRLVAGLVSWTAWLAGRSGQMLLEARRPHSV